MPPVIIGAFCACPALIILLKSLYNFVCDRCEKVAPATMLYEPSACRHNASSDWHLAPNLRLRLHQRAHLTAMSDSESPKKKVRTSSDDYELIYWPTVRVSKLVDIASLHSHNAHVRVSSSPAVENPSDFSLKRLVWTMLIPLKEKTQWIGFSRRSSRTSSLEVRYDPRPLDLL